MPSFPAFPAPVDRPVPAVPDDAVSGSGSHLVPPITANGADTRSAVGVPPNAQLAAREEHDARPNAQPAAREEHDARQASRRRRRSASPLPPLPSPADVPEDAVGRVAFLAIAVAPDVVPTVTPAASEEEPAREPMSAPVHPFDQWLPVILLGAAMVVVFVVGVVVTR